MPEGAVNEIYSMTIDGEDIAYFPEMTFSRVGVYNYTIWQEKGNNVDCTYDDSTYNITVYVTNKENGDGLEATSVLYKNSKYCVEVAFYFGWLFFLYKKLHYLSFFD